jgi:iron complex outermembrane recepter protein
VKYESRVTPRSVMSAAASSIVLASVMTWSDVASAQSSQLSGASALPPITVQPPRARAQAKRTQVARPQAPAQPTAPASVPANPNSVMGLSASYAGGQVATGSQLGLLGARSVMDTPFNQTSYTQKTIQDQQARKLDDVFANDPSIRTNAPRSYGFDFVQIRGFDVASTAYGINGLYGISSNFTSSSLSAIERVEVLKGPGTLLTGMPPAGGVGGSVNQVTKRAGDEPLAQITNTFSSRSQFGTHLDVGRRFGDNKEFGVRVNGSYRNGGTEISDQKQEVGNAAIGMDYRGERLRVSTDFGYDSNHYDVMQRYVVLGAALTQVPRAPDADKNFMPKWSYWNSENYFALAQAEYDVTSNLTVYAQSGFVTGTAKYLYSDLTVTSLTGAVPSGSPRLNSQEREQMAGQAGFRASVDTGPVHHAINFNVAASEGVTKIINTTGTAFATSIYNPIPSPTPTISVGDPLKTSDSHLSSIGIADTMSIFDKRIQFTVGVRQQYVEANSYSNVTGALTAGYQEQALSPAYALVIKPWEMVSLYANYIEGLEPGSVVAPQYANAGEALPPFHARQYEAGVKVDWGRITTTMSVFDITRPLQLLDAASNRLTQNGESRNRGVEFNVFGAVTESVRLLGGVMFIDARQEKTPGGANDGKRTWGVADVQVNLGAEWDIPYVNGLTVTGRVIHTGSFFADAANRLEAPDWTRVDLGARYTFVAPWNKKPVVLRFSVENVFDQDYWQGTNTDRYIMIGAPRTYMASTTFNF